MVVNNDKLVTVMGTGDKTGAGFHSGGRRFRTVKEQVGVRTISNVRRTSVWFLSMSFSLRMVHSLLQSLHCLQAKLSFIF